MDRQEPNWAYPCSYPFLPSQVKFTARMPHCLIWELLGLSMVMNSAQEAKLRFTDWQKRHLYLEIRNSFAQCSNVKVLSPHCTKSSLEQKWLSSLFTIEQRNVTEITLYRNRFNKYLLVIKWQTQKHSPHIPFAPLGFPGPKLLDRECVARSGW